MAIKDDGGRLVGPWTYVEANEWGIRSDGPTAEDEDKRLKWSIQRILIDSVYTILRNYHASCANFEVFAVVLNTSRDIRPQQRRLST